MKKLFIPIILALSLVLLSSCEKNATGIDAGMGRLNIYVTDAPGVYDSVKVRFSTISAHIDSEWVTVSGDPTTVDLLQWTNGNKLLLGSADVPAGHYSQIRLIIDDAWIVVDQIAHPLDIPSGAKTGLKFGPEFTIEDGSTYEAVIDFDVKKSIVVLGPKHNPHGYKLKPHIRVIPNAVSGSISGTVENPTIDLLTAHAILGPDTVTTSLVDSISGYFKLAFLPEAVYTVSLSDSNGVGYEQSDVSVTAGTNYDLGTITVQ